MLTRVKEPLLLSNSLEVLSKYILPFTRAANHNLRVKSANEPMHFFG